MARVMWSSFECSCLAEKVGNTEEQARLFQFGYDQGQKFIAALKSNKITKEDLGSEVPIGVLLRLQGPTPDFMLGRIFQATAESAFEDVFKSGEHFNSEEDQRLAAENKFRKANCQLLGRKK
jgi:hypothetical protein